MCERCLTPTAWRHFQRLGEARVAKNQLHRVVHFLEQQAEEKLGLARAVLTHHCNHQSVIPYYPEWWRGETPKQLLLQGLSGHPQPPGDPSDL